MAEPPAPGLPPPPMEAILASIKRIIEAPEPATTSTADEDVLELGAPAPAAPLPPAAMPAVATALPDEASLVSPAARAASARAMASIATVAIDPHASANTLDGLVRELIRPMLKEWLDANLSELVERVVTREIARLGGR